MRVGDNVRIPPTTKTSKRGDRFGRIEKIKRKLIGVRMLGSKRLAYFLPKNLGDPTDSA